MASREELVERYKKEYFEVSRPGEESVADLECADHINAAFVMFNKCLELVDCEQDWDSEWRWNYWNRLSARCKESFEELEPSEFPNNAIQLLWKNADQELTRSLLFSGDEVPNMFAECWNRHFSTMSVAAKSRDHLESVMEEKYDLCSDAAYRRLIDRREACVERLELEVKTALEEICKEMGKILDNTVEYYVSEEGAEYWAEDQADCEIEQAQEEENEVENYALGR